MGESLPRTGDVKTQAPLEEVALEGSSEAGEEGSGRAVCFPLCMDAGWWSQIHAAGAIKPASATEGCASLSSLCHRLWALNISAIIAPLGHPNTFCIASFACCWSYLAGSQNVPGGF